MDFQRHIPSDQKIHGR